MSRRLLVLIPSITIALAIFFWSENHVSHPFQTCITSQTAEQSSNNLDKSRFIVARFIGPQIFCSVEFVDTHEGIIAALAGIAVAAFTLTLKWSTDRLWEATLRSAKIAERTLTELEAPILYIEVVTTGININGKENCFNFYHLSYRIVNCGRSPALILNYEDRVDPIRKGNGLPPPLIPTDKTIGHGFYIPPHGQSDNININLFGRFIFSDDAPNDAIRTELFLSVFVKYVAIFSESPIHSIGALLMYDKAFNKFILSGGSGAHNYHRQEKRENAVVSQPS